jgi:hypothetical protein
MGDRYGHLPYRHGHPGYRIEIWANAMGDISIDTVISYIDMGCLVTLAGIACHVIDSQKRGYNACR